MLSGYSLKIVYKQGKKNPANAPNRRPDYVRAPNGRCLASVLIARCSATFRLWQLYTATVQEDEIFKDVPPYTLTGLILDDQADYYTTKEARMAPGLPGGFSAKEHSVLATLLR
jgi:hypothetical protein